MIDESFISKIEELALSATETQEINGRVYTATGLKLLSEPEVQILKVNSLTSLIDVAKIEKLKDDYMFKVESPTKVLLMKTGRDQDNKLSYFASVDVEPYMTSFPFGNALDLEKFIVKVQTCFGNTPSRQTLLESVSKVTTQDEDSLEDNGTSQSVQSKKGVHLKEYVLVQNPVYLMPYRTFPEVDLTDVAYIFRVGRFHDGKPSFTLHAPESNYWQMQCMQKIKSYIQAQQSLSVI